MYFLYVSVYLGICICTAIVYVCIAICMSRSQLPSKEAQKMGRRKHLLNSYCEDGPQTLEPKASLE